MSTTNEPSPPDDGYPWEHAAVLPEDKAMGLELELIELEHEREEAEVEGARTEPIDAEIHEVIDELEEVEEVAAHATEPAPDSHVEIHAPEAAEVVEAEPPASGASS